MTFEHNDTKKVGAYPESVTFKENEMAEEDSELLRSNSAPKGTPVLGANRRVGGKHVTFQLVENKTEDMIELPVSGPLNLFVFLAPIPEVEQAVNHE